MEIEFNTSSIRRQDLTPQVTKRDAAAVSADTTSFTATNSLEGQLQNVPASRSEKVTMAKSLVIDPNYPPAELLDRIATLLAVQNLN
ncbi:MAG: hypothetical protein U1F65_04500 [Verrucomicrobiota bacterium]